MMAKNAPTGPVWIVCLLLYVVAMLAHFRMVHVRADIATWSWIIGYGLLLVATQLRRL
jgi:hypothetical protein